MTIDDIPDITDLEISEPVESAHVVTPRMHRQGAKQHVLKMMQRETLQAVMRNPPEPGHVYHLISNGQYDYWTWVPAMIEWMGVADQAWFSTWTLNRNNCNELFTLIDAGRILQVHFLTGLYFKRREATVYAMLLTGLHARGFRYAATKNHAKIMLLGNAERDMWIVCEGSANFTANPRIEQSVITNDRAVFEFHRQWMQEIFDASERAAQHSA